MSSPKTERLILMLPMIEMSEEERGQILSEFPEGYSGPAPKILEQVFDAFPAYVLCLLQVPAPTGALWVRHFRMKGLMVFGLKKSKTMSLVKERFKRRILE